jgi:hypothetical protein
MRQAALASRSPDWQPQGPGWTSLGGEFVGGCVSARYEMGTLLIVVLTPDRKLHTLEWPGYPMGHAGPWAEDLTLDDLLQAALPTADASVIGA